MPCCTVRSEQSVTLASIIVIYAPAFSSVSVCVSFWVLALHDWVTYFSWPDLSKTHWHFGPSLFICNCPSHTHTHTQKLNKDTRHVCLHLLMGKAKCNIKHTSESKKAEMEASINLHVEVHLERETRPSDAPVLWCRQWWHKLFFFYFVLILPLLQDALDKCVVFSEDSFTKSKATGREWNNASNDQEDGNWETFWTNSGIYLEEFKSHGGWLCSAHDAHTFVGREMVGKVDIAVLR